MTASRLSPAQRNALYAVCLGGLRNRKALPNKAVQTLDSLRTKGLLDADYEPTEAGRRFFVVKIDGAEYTDLRATTQQDAMAHAFITSPEARSVVVKAPR